METHTCPFCSKTIELKNKNPQRGTVSSHRGHCVEYQKYKDKVLTEEFLRNQYDVLGKSAKEISDDTKINVKYVIIRLQAFGFETRNISQSKKEGRAQSRAAITNLERFGSSHNFNRDHPSRIEWQERILEEEGIVNVFQRRDVIDKIAVSISKTPGGRHGSRITRPHKLVASIVEELGFEIQLEFRPVGSRCFYDILVKGTNLLIEVNGSVFHGEPRLYKGSDYIAFIKRNVIDMWKRDKRKITKAEELGYTILVIWELDIKNDIEMVKATIGKYLNDGQDISHKVYKESIKYLEEV